MLRFSSLFRASVLVAPAFVLVACASADDAPTPGDDADLRADAGRRADAGQNDAGTCDTSACPGDQACRAGACEDPTPRQRTQLAAVGAMIDALAQSSAWHEPVDAAAVKADARRAIFKGEGTDLAYVEAAWRALNAYPQGHQGLFSDDPSVCGKVAPYQYASRFGVCGRPVTGGLVVTLARSGNKLGLRAGDVITAAAGDAGEALLEAAYRRPVCGGTFPSKEGRRHAGAASFFGTIPAGAKLAVRAPQGTTREVVVPSGADAQLTDCTDVFARSRQVYAEASVRPDGVAVIRLPSFFPWDKQAPTQEPAFTAFVDAYRAEVVKVFQTVKTSKAIVWDARGNTGGITPVGLAIVAGFPSARATAISYCRTRTPGTTPPSWDTERYAEYAVTPGGPFAYTGKVAVLTDGLAYSAGDYFPLAVTKASSAVLVGTSSAGAFGGGRAPIALAGPPALEANYDPTACFDAATNTPLEGNPPPPSIAAEYAPADLAAGKDTVLERAVKALGF
jgi:hypothetical protein